MSRNHSEDENDDFKLRSPDEITREKLLDYNNHNSDDELNAAINQSITEYNEYIKKMCDEEKKLMEYIKTEKRNRREICEPILFEVKKLSRFDNEIKQVYDILEPILDSYMSQYIDRYEFDKETNNFIFNVLSKLRIKRENMEILKTIIL